jgi:hypothetical protein
MGMAQTVCVHALADPRSLPKARHEAADLRGQDRRSGSRAKERLGFCEAAKGPLIHPALDDGECPRVDTNRPSPSSLSVQNSDRHACEVDVLRRKGESFAAPKPGAIHGGE